MLVNDSLNGRSKIHKNNPHGNITAFFTVNFFLRVFSEVISVKIFA
jgi:hypothetical protein